MLLLMFPRKIPLELLSARHQTKKTTTKKKKQHAPTTSTIIKLETVVTAKAKTRLHDEENQSSVREQTKQHIFPTRWVRELHVISFALIMKSGGEIYGDEPPRKQPAGRVFPLGRRRESVLQETARAHSYYL